MRDIALMNFEYFLKNGIWIVFNSQEEYLARVGLAAHHFANLTGCPYIEAFQIIRKIIFINDQGETVIRHFTPPTERPQLGELLIRAHAKVMFGQLAEKPFYMDEILRTNIPRVAAMIATRVSITQTEAEAFLSSLFLESLSFGTTH